MTEEDKAVCKLLVLFSKMIRQLEEKGTEHDNQEAEKPAKAMGAESMEACRATDR